MKNITVYVVTTPKGKVSVRTRPVTAEGYTTTEAVMNWKAVRTIARIWKRAEQGKLEEGI